MREVIGLIYETIGTPEAWNDVLARMAEGLGASAALFFKPVPGAPELLAQRNIIPALLDEYLAYYHAKDILVRSSIGRERELAGRALRVEDLMAEASFRHSEFFNDFLRRHAIADVLSSPIVDPAAPSAPPPILGFYRPPHARRFSEAEARRMQAHLPHIERALRLRNSLTGQVPAWTGTLIEQLPAGVFVIDGRGRVIHANGAARAIVDERDGLSLSDGTLHSGGGSALDAAFAAALSVSPVGRDLLVARRSGAAWLVSVCPLSRPEAERHWA
ncbi:MAG: PAS domain-containing protein, partial [Acetobacteraceae bacterium]